MSKKVSKKVILITGFPGSGKSSYTQDLVDKGYVNLNRDKLGSTEKVLDQLGGLLSNVSVVDKIVLDNTYGTKESRAEVIRIAKICNADVECWEMDTSMEDSQFNAVQRQIERTGKLMGPEDFKLTKDVNLFAPVVIYTYKNKYEEPTIDEGFSVVKKLKFTRNPFPDGFRNKAVIFDYDGTLRETISGNKYPVTPDDIRILPGRIEKLKQLEKEGYFLLGVSNQSGVAKGDLTAEMARKCFEKTNKLLGFDIDVEFCPHSIPPVVCFCRKPSPGLGVHFIHKYKLDPKKVIMVGDMTSDKTFAKRCGFSYVDQKDFF